MPSDRSSLRFHCKSLFSGKVLGQEQKYILKRTYVLNPAGKPLESVSLNMNGNMFVYGTMTAPKERIKNEQEVNKIIKANLPQELSQYFLLMPCSRANF